MVPAFLLAQDSAGFFVGVGLNHQTVREKRFTPVYRGGSGFAFRVGYERLRGRRVSTVGLAVDQAITGRDLLSPQRNLALNLNYERLWALPRRPELQLGGYTGLTAWAAIRTQNWSDNNPASYVIAFPLGIAARYRTDLGRRAWVTRLSLPLISYYVRPAYGSAAPGALLRPGEFSFRPDVTPGLFLSSGRFGLPHRFARVALSTQLFHRLGKRSLVFGTGYQFIGHFTNEDKALTRFYHALRLTLRRL